jgi:hypothetical protein
VHLDVRVHPPVLPDDAPVAGQGQGDRAAHVAPRRCDAQLDVSGSTMP